MKAILILWSLGFSLASLAAVELAQTRRSDQFIIHDERTSRAPSALAKPTENGEPMVDVEPDVLLISSERIRHALLKELKVSSTGSGKIHLFLNRASPGGDQIRIQPKFYAGTWQYRVDIPDRVGQLKLIRGIVDVVLLELANRGAGSKSAEIPLWMTEGFSLRLLSSVGSNPVVQSVPSGFMARAVWEMHGLDILRDARATFRVHKALSFAELNHPSLEDLRGEALKVYQLSAQVFLHELSRLPDGKASLFQMLRELPYCWNPETAFLRAFQSRFQRALDVEKWWSLTLISLVGPDLAQPMTVEACLQKLDNILLAPVEVRSATNAIPVRSQMSLQQVVADWDFTRQRIVLEQTLVRLQALRYTAPGEAIPLIDGYRLALHSYLQRRAQAAQGLSSKRQVAVPATLVIHETIKELDQLYRQREVLRRSQMSVSKTPDGNR